MTSRSSVSACTSSAAPTACRVSTRARSPSPGARRRRRRLGGHAVRGRRFGRGRRRRHAVSSARPDRPASSPTSSNGCATGGTALFSRRQRDHGRHLRHRRSPSASTSTSAAHSASTRRRAGLGDWYGADGLSLTTQFFGMKINRYMHEYGITHETLAKVAAKAFRNGAMNPMAWRRKPMSEEEILASPMLSYPLTQYMFCSPGEGGVALVLCRGRQGPARTPTARCSSRPRSCAVAPLRLASRCSARRWRRRGSDGAHRRRVERRVRDGRHRPRGRRRRPAAGHRGRRRSHAHGRERLLRRRRAGGRSIADGATEIGGPAPGQHRRRLPRQRRAHRRVGPAPGLRERAAAARRRRRPPGARTTRASATPTCTARPASPASPSSLADGLRRQEPLAFVAE